MRKKRTNIDYGQVLMFSAVVVAMPRWAGAFIAADVATMPPLVSEFLHYLNLASGLGMGLLEVLGAYYLLEAWGRTKPKRTHNAKNLDYRWILLTGFVFGLFLLMPIILAPYIVARMTSQPIATVLDNYQLLWAVAIVLSPVFIVGGTAVARGGAAAVAPKTVATSDQPAASSRQDEAEDRQDRQDASLERRDVGNLPSDWRQLTGEQRHVLASLSRQDRQDIFPDLAARTARQWHSRLDAIAASNGRGGDA